MWVRRALELRPWFRCASVMIYVDCLSEAMLCCHAAASLDMFDLSCFCIQSWVEYLDAFFNPSASFQSMVRTFPSPLLQQYLRPAVSILQTQYSDSILHAPFSHRAFAGTASAFLSLLNGESSLVSLALISRKW